MNTQKILLPVVVIMTLLSIQRAKAQQAMIPANSSQKIMPPNEDNTSYSYKLYKAPGGMYGYDLYKDGKPVYHQFVLLYVSKEGKRIVASKPQAQKAASMAIEKIQKGQPPVLYGEELKKVVAL